MVEASYAKRGAMKSTLVALFMCALSSEGLVVSLAQSCLKAIVSCEYERPSAIFITHP
jgi:hypothetical protein